MEMSNLPDAEFKTLVIRMLNDLGVKKEIKKHTNKLSIYHVHGLEELTSSKCTYYPKQFIH